MRVGVPPKMWVFDKLVGYTGPLDFEKLADFLMRMYEEAGNARPDCLLMGAKTCVDLFCSLPVSIAFAAMGKPGRGTHVGHPLDGEKLRVVYYDLPRGTVVAPTPLDRVVWALVPEAGR